MGIHYFKMIALLLNAGNNCILRPSEIYYFFVFHFVICNLMNGKMKYH